MNRKCVTALPERAAPHQAASVHRDAAAASRLQVLGYVTGLCAVVSLVGELDIAEVTRVSDGLRALLSQNRSRIVLDLSGLTFCDAAGLGVLIRYHLRAGSQGGWLRLTGLNPRTIRLLELARVTHVFAVFGTVAGAMADVTTART